MMVRRQSVAFIALLLGALVLAACGIDGEQRGPASTWGRGAEEWLANVQEAGREGVPNLEAFLTADVVLDHRGTGGEVAKGVGQSLSLVRHLEYTQPRTRLRPPPYLSRGGTVVPAVWEGPDLLTVQDAVLVMTLSPLGLVREETASALVSGHNLVDPGRDWAVGGSCRQVRRRPHHSRRHDHAGRHSRSRRPAGVRDTEAALR